MTATLILGGISALLILVILLTAKFRKLKDDNSFLESENETLDGNNKVLTKKGEDQEKAIHAFEDLEGDIGTLERKKKAKEKELNEVITNGDNKSASDFFNGLSDNERDG